MQMAARHGLTINHIPMRMQDVYAGSGGILLADRSWQRQAYRIHELKRWSTRLGVRVNIEPRHFPTDVDVASCMVIAAQRAGLDVADFVNACVDRKPISPGFEDGLKNQRVLESVAESVKTRRWVKV